MNNHSEYDRLLSNVGTTLEQGRRQAAYAVNSAMVQTYWEIGRQIVEYEQHGNEKAEYGADVLNRLSKDLTDRYGKGFSHSNVVYMRRLYLTYSKSQTLSDFLSWSHYIELLKIDDPLERSFYERECEEEHWGVRELKRQMKSMLFHRLALSTDKQEVLKLAAEGQIIEKAEDILKETYVFEFTGLPQLPVYEEGDLEEALVNNLSMFFLELGKGFTYVGRQQRMVIECFVLIDLKRGEVQHEDIGPIGIILGAYQDKLVMHYALQHITNQVFVSRYQLYLPNREQLASEFRRFMRNEEEAE